MVTGYFVTLSQKLIYKKFKLKDSFIYNICFAVIHFCEIETSAGKTS